MVRPTWLPQKTTFYLNIILSTTYIAVTIFEMVMRVPMWVFWIDHTLWLYFGIVYVRGWQRARDKKRYFVTHLIDLIALTPFKSLRFLKILRLLKVLTLIGNILNKVFRKTNIANVFYVVATIVIAVSVAFHFVEHESYMNSFYWAIITVSTVGYGDVSAHTTLGKLLSILMALGGVGMFGVLTSSITSYFQEENEALQEEVAEMKLQLNRIEKLLIQQKEQ
ncbi:hypothetical protein EFL41_10840 [Weissella cibaria]|uniref:potassium channel family protein n=1 Tax=Weissella cibaria TaxID=137591 RepID=UPI00189C8053|nr:potassium channel family protein [Weissella cibaria]MCT0954024.1 hypothetical protein [Weissella cibaria]